MHEDYNKIVPLPVKGWGTHAGLCARSPRQFRISSKKDLVNIVLIQNRQCLCHNSNGILWEIKKKTTRAAGMHVATKSLVCEFLVPPQCCFYVAVNKMLYWAITIPQPGAAQICRSLRVTESFIQMVIMELMTAQILKSQSRKQAAKIFFCCLCFHIYSIG